MSPELLMMPKPWRSHRTTAIATTPLRIFEIVACIAIQAREFESVGRAGEAPPDLVLLDIMMPGMTATKSAA
jgi:CheY-like chemotaxis protein